MIHISVFGLYLVILGGAAAGAFLVSFAVIASENKELRDAKRRAKLSDESARLLGEELKKYAVAVELLREIMASGVDDPDAEYKRTSYLYVQVDREDYTKARAWLDGRDVAKRLAKAAKELRRDAECRAIMEGKPLDLAECPECQGRGSIIDTTGGQREKCDSCGGKGSV